MLKNQQPAKGPVKSDGSALLVHSIFPTIQGEGPYAGHAAVFVRLADCNLQCPLCDTEYTAGATERDVETLAIAVASIGPKLVVITGGEPFRQNLSQFVKLLLTLHCRVQIETNGFLAPQQGSDTRWLDQITVVCAPKTHKLAAGILPYIDAYKYVLRADDLAPDGLPISALDHPLPAGAVIARPPKDFDGPIYLQPLDSQSDELNALNVQAAVKAVQTNPCHILCLQLHKIIGLD